MKFQNPSMHGSKDMAYIKKHNERTYEHTDGQPKSNMPLLPPPPPHLNFFKVGGIIKWANIHNNTDNSKINDEGCWTKDGGHH